MIFRKSTSYHAHIVFVLSIILVIILVLLALLLIRGEEALAPSFEVYDNASLFSYEKIREQYTLDVGELEIMIAEEHNDIEALLIKSEGALLQMRVPPELRDSHLQAVLDMSDLRAQVGVVDDVVLYQRLQDIVATLNRR